MRIRAAAAWTWLAELDDELVGRAVWWAPPGGAWPLELDLLTVAPTVEDRVAVAAALLAPGVAAATAAGDAPACNLIVPPDWHDAPEIAAEVAWRLDACARAGLGRVVDRRRFEWTPDIALPPSPARLRLVDDEDAIRALFARISGDADAFEDYVRAAISRDGWRIAYAGADPVGVTMPSMVDGGDVVAFVGVAVEHRGRGHAHELLAHATRHLAGGGATRIVGDTDADNAPMAAAFRRGGYREVAARLTITA